MGEGLLGSQQKHDLTVHRILEDELELSPQVIVQVQQPLGASGPSQDPQSLHFTESSGSVLRLSTGTSMP